MRLWAAVLACAAGFPGVQAEPPDRQGAYYYYFDERRELALDFTGAAVRRRESGARADAGRHLSGWSRVPFAARQRNESGVREAVAGLSVDEGVEFASPVFVGASGGPIIITSQILVGFHDAVTAEEAEAVLASVEEAVVVDRDWGGMRGAYRLAHSSRDGFDVLSTANALAERPEVLFAEPNLIFGGRGGLIPNDPYFSYSWGLHNKKPPGGGIDADIDAPEAWDVTTGQSGVVVAIIDTGVQFNHPDLNLIPGTDTTSDGPGIGEPVNNLDNHGTAVAGVISSRINNDQGTAGVAPDCPSASARTFIATDDKGHWTSETAWTVDSLAWAEANGVRVTNNSNAYDVSSAAIAQKYAQTRQAGMIHFASAHNDGEPVMTFPAVLPSVNALAAMMPDGTRAPYSNFGPGLDFCAPGDEILSTDRTGQAGFVIGDYLVGFGTTFASPFAAGVAALVLSRNPGLGAQMVEQILQDSSVDLGTPGFDSDYGWGFVNAHQALMLAEPSVRGACCVAGECADDLTALGCQFVAGGEPGTRWFANRDCASVQCLPSNTKCTLAEAIPADGIIELDNSHLTSLPNPLYECGAADSHDGTLWFSFVAATDSVRINSCQSKGANSTFAVYESCETGIAVACSEDDGRCAAGPKLGDQCITGLTAGQEYFVQFSAWSPGDRGSYTLQIQSPCPPPSPVPDVVPILENRSFSLSVPPAVPGATATEHETALRVQILELQNPVPPNLPQFPPPDFSAYESGPNCVDPLGCARWVGPVKTYYEGPSGQSTTFRAARLQCEPFYHDWSMEGTFYVIGAEIMPSSTYEVYNVAASCMGSEDTCSDVSGALRVTTGRYGDVAPPFNPPGTTNQPDGVDVVSMVNKFKSLSGAPSKAAAQLQPNTPEPNNNVDSLDIVACIDAFKGFPYPYSGPCVCPSAVVCNAAPCTSAASCRGGTCTKTCAGGMWDGLPCTNNAHCAGGECGPGFCRDACGRCKP